MGALRTVFVRTLGMGIHTTNTAESHNGKIKALTSRCMTDGECTRCLLSLQQDRDYETSHKEFTSPLTLGLVPLIGLAETCRTKASMAWLPRPPVGQFRTA